MLLLGGLKLEQGAEPPLTLTTGSLPPMKKKILGTPLLMTDLLHDRRSVHLSTELSLSSFSSEIIEIG